MQGEPFQINGLTPVTFTRLSKVSKTQAEAPEQTLAATTAPQAPAAEPTAQGDHSSKTTIVKPTPKSTKRPRQKKTQKPLKPKTKATLEDEIQSNCR